MEESVSKKKIADISAFKQQCRETSYHLRQADFSKAALGGAMLCGDVDYPDLTLETPRFIETDLRLAHCLGWKCRNGIFEDSLCAGARFYRCDFIDVTFNRVVYFESGVPLLPTQFIASQLHFADFSGGNLSHVTFDGCALEGVDFKDCDLRHARFLDCDLKGAEFKHASLDGVQLNNSKLEAGQLSAAEADDWTTVDVSGTGMTLAALRSG
ncbi:MAG: pentapeptide repeat-containing protein [Candidatus Thiodiazotropha endolucinida]|nr:pentapeptide repeat-containing protein [Candidatus Thiodiazotropha taylori]MCG8117525.1 pentapeptide repeat-containing protein [Candidatus Thiodiazotropha taylori]MCW4263462.1 pentapeptide repeat-containing protein [Candidatus Thiodiazotropha endolucinida]MCW4301818.1 pentapeptide repeat-containing protein [Candidatus Thiodiazotropha endolucinida]